MQPGTHLTSLGTDGWDSSQIDVEGYELDVMRTAKHLLKVRNPTLAFFSGTECVPAVDLSDRDRSQCARWARAGEHRFHYHRGEPTDDGQSQAACVLPAAVGLRLRGTLSKTFLLLELNPGIGTADTLRLR